MRTLPLRPFRTTLCAALLLAAPAAWSQPPGSLDTWVDACELPSHDLVGLLDQEALIVNSAAVHDNGDGTFLLDQQPYTTTLIQNPIPLCPESIFYGQPQVDGDNFRSAVVVGKDLVLTAWHNAVTSVPDVRVIFGLRYRQLGDSCVPPDFTHIPAARVFTPVQVVAWVYPDPDMVVFRLDREVGVAPLRVRRSGQGRPGDAMTMIAHPDRLATKVDLAGVLTGYSTAGNGLTSPLVANLHTLVGSSGSMVYNRSERFVETVAAGWIGTTYAPCSGNIKVVHVDGAASTNESVKHFSRFIPAFELLVQPLDTIVHAGPVGGPFTNPSFERVVRAPLTASGPIAYQIAELADTHQPRLSITVDVPQQGTLAPGAFFTVKETIDADSAPCGVYERTYAITDATHGYTDIVRHVFEIGLDECPGVP